MDVAQLQNYLTQGEGVHIEFKRCGALPGEDTFQTICAFANHFGGNVFLGIGDDGRIEGVGVNPLEIQRNIANVLANPQLFDPYLMIETEVIDTGKAKIIRIWVPQSPEVHTYKGVAYDRAADADIKLHGTAQITALGMRKQQIYTERQVFPSLSAKDLRADILDRIREMATQKQAGHPWASMKDAELLRSANFIVRDPQTGEEGITRAAVLLAGKDEVINAICPAYRTDAIYIQDEFNRYDDRLVVQTNLIDSFDLLCEFCRKHTNDPFFLDGNRVVSARDIVIRELVSNTLIHREYLSPYLARIVIDENGIKTENANRPLFDGPLTLENLSPTPKNPITANFFMQIGLAEELGSGVRNLYRYSKPFMGADPELYEGNTFVAVVPNGHNEKPSKIGTVDQAILALLAEAGHTTSAEVAKVANTTTRTASEHLRKMVASGQLVAEGNTNTRRYRLASRLQ